MSIASHQMYCQLCTSWHEIGPCRTWESAAAEARQKFQEQCEKDSIAEPGISSAKHDHSIDKVSPPHYKGSGMEVIDVIDAFGLDLYQGSIVQYIIRYKDKDGVTDLKKAKWYLDRLIEKEIRAHNKRPTSPTNT